MSDDANNKTPAPVRCPKPTHCVQTVCMELTPAATHQSPSKGLNFLDKIMQSLDPDHQAQCDTQQTLVLFQSQQLILLQAQIRDLNQLIQNLQMQLGDSKRHWVDADQCTDCLENQIYISSIVNQAQAQ